MVDGAPAPQRKEGTACWWKANIKGWDVIPNLEPNIVYADLINNSNSKINEALTQLDNGEIKFLSVGLDSKTENGYKTFAVIQRGLISLGLISINKDNSCNLTDFEFGVYGEKTTPAVAKLQKEAGINDGREGKYFGRRTFRALKYAMALASKGYTWSQIVEQGLLRTDEAFRYINEPIKTN